MLPGIGLFGSGIFARLLVSNLREHNFRVVAIWSREPDELRALLADLGEKEDDEILVSRRIDTIILHPKVQLIVVACFPHLHHQIVSKACRLGKHVICSMPPASSLTNAMLMATSASEYPSLITLTISPLRFVPAFSIMRELIQNDQLIGTVRFITATVNCDVKLLYEENPKTWEQNVGGGLMSIFGVHVIDIISYVTGLRAKRVNAIVKRLNFTDNTFAYNLINAEDFINFQMELVPSSEFDFSIGMPTKEMNYSIITPFIERNTVSATVTLNGFHCEQNATHELKIYGTNGYLVCRENNLFGKLRSKGHPIKESNFYIDDEDNKTRIHSDTVPELHQLGLSRFVAAVHSSFDHKNNSKRNSIDNASGKFQSENTSENHDSAVNELVKNDNLPIGKDLNYIDNMVNNNSVASDIKTINSKSIDMNGGDQAEEEQIIWSKDAVLESANFDDALFTQATVEAIRQSARNQQWIGVELNVDN